MIPTRSRSVSFSRIAMVSRLQSNAGQRIQWEKSSVLYFLCGRKVRTRILHYTGRYLEFRVRLALTLQLFLYLLFADLPSCSGGERLRLICMGKGILTPDARSLEDCQIPVFKTHPTPINVSIRPVVLPVASEKHPRHVNTTQSAGGNSISPGRTGTATASQGCACTIL